MEDWNGMGDWDEKKAHERLDKSIRQTSENQHDMMEMFYVGMLPVLGNLEDSDPYGTIDAAMKRLGEAQNRQVRIAQRWIDDKYECHRGTLSDLWLEAGVKIMEEHKKLGEAAMAIVSARGPSEDAAESLIKMRRGKFDTPRF